MNGVEVIFLLAGFTLLTTLGLGSTLFHDCLYKGSKKNRDRDKTTV